MEERGFEPCYFRRVSRLYQIQEAVRQRVDEIVSVHVDWPCRKGCGECCRSLASAPLVTREEWQSIAVALRALREETARAARQRIEPSAEAVRPVTCPLLDTCSGTCLVYEARPVACREYGFYAEREAVLGCNQIASMAARAPDVLWGNHAALQDWLRALGESKTLAQWLGTAG